MQTSDLYKTICIYIKQRLISVQGRPLAAENIEELDVLSTDVQSMYQGSDQRELLTHRDMVPQVKQKSSITKLGKNAIG